MDRNDLTEEQYDKLLMAIGRIVKEFGPKHTTMDIVASRLSMSKRTLYEIFGSKDEMMICVMHHIHDKMARDMEQIVKGTENVMEAMVKVISYYKELMSDLNANFFRDMDNRYRRLREEYDHSDRNELLYLTQAVRLGVQQGVFRKEVNYQVMLRLLRVQMESLKRMEELFPPEITIMDAYNTIISSFLRTIATPEGMKVIERLADNYPIL